MKFGKREASYIVALIGFLAAILVYTMYYTQRQTETETIEADNRVKEKRVEQLRTWHNEEPMYEEQSEKMLADMKSIFEIYPADYLEEDMILYATQLEARNSSTFIGNIEMEDPILVFEIGPTTQKIIGTEEDGPHSYELYNSFLTYTHQYSYNGMKQFITDISKDADRRPLSGVAVKYDNETGLLVGQTFINVLTMKGNGKEYQKPDITGVPVKTSNPFGTIASPTEVVTEDAAE